MLCPDCKTKVPDKYTYCPKCGASIPLYRIEKHSVNRFVPVICSMLAVGGLSTVAVMSAIRTRAQAPQSIASVEEVPVEEVPATEAPAAEVPAAESAAPEESSANITADTPVNAAIPAINFAPAPEDSVFSSSAVAAEHVAALSKFGSGQAGDVNGDGSVDASDAQMILADYTERLVGHTGILTDEQRKCGAVTGFSDEPTVSDAQTVLQYYAACLADPTLEEIGLQAWCSKQEAI